MIYQRYFLQLAYKGTNYHGWQIQPNAVTVQGTVNNALSTLLKYETEAVGAGRTDTGVHARNYTAHFDTTKQISYDIKTFIYKINCILPNDIALLDMYPVDKNIHARFSATSRSYYYVISYKKEVFSNDYCWYIKQPLDIEKLRKASELIPGIKDFTSFSRLHSDVKTNICNVFNVRWLTLNNRLVLYIESDRFLRNMVRALVGTLIEIGNNKLPIDALTKIANAKDRAKAGASAPAQGLFFNSAKYLFKNTLS